MPGLVLHPTAGWPVVESSCRVVIPASRSALAHAEASRCTTYAVGARWLTDAARLGHFVGRWTTGARAPRGRPWWPAVRRAVVSPRLGARVGPRDPGSTQRDLESGALDRPGRLGRRSSWVDGR